MYEAAEFSNRIGTLDHTERKLLFDTHINTKKLHDVSFRLFCYSNIDNGPSNKQVFDVRQIFESLLRATKIV